MSETAPKDVPVFPRTDVTERQLARLQQLRIKSGVVAGEVPSNVDAVRTANVYGNVPHY
jgi:hypothetical protein